jgi:AraC family transcriptional regulator
LPVGVDRDLAHAADLVERETRCPGHRSEAYLAAAGRLLAEQTLRAVQDAKAGPGVHAPTPEYWVARARPLVERSIYSSASLGRVLGGLGIGYRQITRHFRTVLGTTPKQHQLDCRMSEARRLLRSTDLSVTSIALELGFSDSQHFSTLFAHREGTCPSNWRRESRSPGAR